MRNEEGQDFYVVQETDILLQHDPEKNSPLADPCWPSFSPYARCMRDITENPIMTTQCTYALAERTSPLTIWYAVQKCEAGSCSGLRGLHGHQSKMKRISYTCSSHSVTLKTLMIFFALRREPSSRTTRP